jgi:hypothetical protein
MNKKIKNTTLLIFVLLFSLLFSGCIPKNMLLQLPTREETTEETTSEEIDGEYVPHESTAFTGSAKKLSGKVILVTILVSDVYSDWTEYEKQRVQGRITTASEYIMENAEYYGESLELIYDNGWTEDLTYETFYNGEIKDFDDLQGVYEDPYQETMLEAIASEIPEEQLLQKYGAESIAYVGVIDKDGRSYAYPYQPEYGDDYYNECACVFYTDETFGEEEPPAVYAHEILHLLEPWIL